MNSKSLLTGLALLVLFFGIINNFDWQTAPEREIAYSEFLRLADKGDIKSVVIQGNVIKGVSGSNERFKSITVHYPELIDHLRKKNVVIEVRDDEGSEWYWAILVQWGPLLALIAVWVFMIKRMPGSGKIMSIGKSKARQFEGEENVKITFEDVAGAEEAKEELSEVVNFLKDPEKFQKLGGQIPKGALMVGPPGTGKTLLAKAVAGEAEVPFFSISGSDFVEMFVGVGASRVRDLFEEGRKSAPCIIFIDEIDAVGRHRGAGLGSGHDEREQTLNALLVEMDGFDGSEGIIIIAATNRMDILDPALLRPGRFDRQVMVGLPDVKGREKILEVHSKKIVLDKEADLESIAKGTSGFSGAELANLINESALRAARLNKDKVGTSDMEWARDKIMMGTERQSMIMPEDEKKASAYREAGHALVAYNLKNSDPIHKITIIPRGLSIGLTSFLPENDRLSLDKEFLISKIMIAMGGRAAEALILKNFSTGVEKELKKATNMAYQMICEWGMSENLGAFSVPYRDSGNFLALDYNSQEPVSEEMLQAIDKEAYELLGNCYKKTKKILFDNKTQLKALAALLLEEETVTFKQMEELLRTIPADAK